MHLAIEPCQVEKFLPRKPVVVHVYIACVYDFLSGHLILYVYMHVHLVLFFVALYMRDISRVDII